MTFDNNYNNIKSLANEELKKIEHSMVLGFHAPEPLYTSVKNFLTSPSKKIRSVLCILYSKALGIKLNPQHFELLSAIELIHNASLIHDDIIDKSKYRRGEKTIWAEFDNKLGVITGDYILSIAMEKIVKLNNIDILQKIINTIKQMCIGEINQNFSRYKIGTIENYIEKSKNKTAYLFESALASTLMLSHNKNQIKKACEFALNFGLAFQIRDDLMNIISTDNTKPTGNDIEDGIYSAAIIYAQDIKNYSSGIEKHSNLLNNYVKYAKDCLKNLPDNNYKQNLNNLVELLIYDNR